MATSVPAGKDSAPAPQQQYRQNMRPRSPSLEKYRRVEKPREPTPDDEIRVMGTGRVGKYVTYAAKLFKEQEKRALTIRATGKAISIAVSVCEVVKRRFKGLHQVTTIGWTEIFDEYEPLEAGLEPRSEKRSVPSISVFLTFDEAAVDTKAVGYQVPLDESLVEERDTEALTNSGNRQRRDPRKRAPRGPKPEGQEDNEQVNASGENARPARGGRRRNRGGARRTPKQDGEGSQVPVVAPQTAD